MEANTWPCARQVWTGECEKTSVGPCLRAHADSTCLLCPPPPAPACHLACYTSSPLPRDATGRSLPLPYPPLLCSCVSPPFPEVAGRPQIGGPLPRRHDVPVRRVPPGRRSPVPIGVPPPPRPYWRAPSLTPAPLRAGRLEGLLVTPPSQRSTAKGESQELACSAPVQRCP